MQELDGIIEWPGLPILNGLSKRIGRVVYTQFAPRGSLDFEVCSNDQLQPLFFLVDGLRMIATISYSFKRTGHKLI
jgi:hypothetical protein